MPSRNMNYNRLSFFLLSVFLCGALCAQETAHKTEVEFELDPYYSSVGLYNSLTGKPIPHMPGASELEIYKELVTKFYLPRTMVLEASINPLPYAGTLVRKHQPDFYQDMQLTSNLNAIKAATAGFEEPWALSLFFGNVITFESVKKSFQGKRTGYSGILIDTGNFHIKDNTLVHDKWFQFEAKIKGEQFLTDRTLLWSFRVGAKTHGNRNIADSFFVGFRRSRTDFGKTGNFWLNNSGFEYVSDFSRATMEPIRHLFLLTKKLPVGKKTVLSLGTGFMWTSGKKYSGRLEDTGATRNSFQFLLRPNLEF